MDRILRTEEDILAELFADDEDDLDELGNHEGIEDEAMVTENIDEESAFQISSANLEDLEDYDSDDVEVTKPDGSTHYSELKRKVLTKNRLVNSIASALDETNFEIIPPPTDEKMYISKIGKSFMEWTNVRPLNTVRQCRSQVITGKPGLTSYSKNAQNALEAWSLLITPDIINSICEYTSKKITEYRMQKDESFLEKYTFVKQTSAVELLAFIGLMYARALLNLGLHDLDLLFSDKIGHPIFGATMGKNRFCFLSQMISFDDIDTRTFRWQSDRFAAFREIFEKFNKNCAKSLVPEDCLSLDETLYTTRVQIGFKQYNPNKPAKYGLLFRSVNSARYAFTHFSMVYAGKPVGNATNYYVKGMDETVQYLISELSKLVPIGGRNISLDRLYTSNPLAKWLLSCNITLVGTIKSNRVGIPKEIKDTEGRAEFSSEFFWEKSEKKLGICSYVCNTKSSGKKNVLLLTTTPFIFGVTKYDKKLKPSIYKLYDFTKGGTDIIDQRMGFYSTKTKSRKWTHNAFCYLLDTARVNSSTLFSLAGKVDPKKLKSFEFGWSLVMQLTTPFIEERNLRQLSQIIKQKISIILGQGTNHQVETDGAENNSQRGTRRRCVMCTEAIRNTTDYSKKMRSMSRVPTQCQICQDACCEPHSFLICNKCK